MGAADPQAIGKNDNVFGLLPVNTGLKIAAWLMVVHQVNLPKTFLHFSAIPAVSGQRLSTIYMGEVSEQ